MKKFVTPKTKTSFTKWLLRLSNDNNWTIVLEYEKRETYNLLVQNATTVILPKTTAHNYDENYHLTAIEDIIITEQFISKLFTECSALSVHNEKEILFLIADDFHEDCFSCNQSFFDMFYSVAIDLDLIFEN